MLLLGWKACTCSEPSGCFLLAFAEMSLFILLRSSRLFFPVNFTIIYMTKFWQSPSICLVWPLPSSRTRVRNPEQQNMGRGAPHLTGEELSAWKPCAVKPDDDKDNEDLPHSVDWRKRGGVVALAEVI